MNDLYRDATDEDVASAFIFDNKALQRALKHIYEKDFQPMKVSVNPEQNFLWSSGRK